MRHPDDPAGRARASTTLLLVALAVVFPVRLPQAAAQTTDTLVMCPPPSVGPREDRGLVELPEITEASGIVASRKNPGVLWVHNDSGNLNALYAMDSRGRHLGTYLLPGASNRDWEDMAIGPGPDSLTDYLYVGDIGDNRAAHDVKLVYRVPEPSVDTLQSPRTVNLSHVEQIAVRYADGMVDAETLLLDPLTRDLFVITKQAGPAGIYRIAFPQSTVDTAALERVGLVMLPLAVGGDVSPSGREILLKNYSTIFYWCRKPGQSIWEALSVPGQPVPYTAEPQGEAVAWGAEGECYYTVSEELLGMPAHLYLYRRIATGLPPR